MLAELPQGVRSDEDARLLEEHLAAFPVLRLAGVEDFALAAWLLREGFPLLHRDADFDRLASCTELEVVAA